MLMHFFHGLLLRRLTALIIGSLSMLLISFTSHDARFVCIVSGLMPLVVLFLHVLQNQEGCGIILRTLPVNSLHLARCQWGTLLLLSWSLCLPAWLGLGLGTLGWLTAPEAFDAYALPSLWLLIGIFGLASALWGAWRPEMIKSKRAAVWFQWLLPFGVVLPLWISLHITHSFLLVPARLSGLSMGTLAVGILLAGRALFIQKIRSGYHAAIEQQVQVGDFIWERQKSSGFRVIAWTFISSGFIFGTIVCLAQLMTRKEKAPDFTMIMVYYYLFMGNTIGRHSLPLEQLRLLPIARKKKTAWFIGLQASGIAACVVGLGSVGLLLQGSVITKDLLLLLASLPLMLALALLLQVAILRRKQQIALLVILLAILALTILYVITIVFFAPLPLSSEFQLLVVGLALNALLFPFVYYTITHADIPASQ